MAAVVAMPHPRWGETPCAFVEIKPGAKTIDADALHEHCRQVLAGFKQPRHFVFGEITKTSTGKVQKFLLRQRAADIALTLFAKT